MTNEEAIDELSVIYERLSHPEDCESGFYSFRDGDYLKALELAIKALETGEVYMTGEDYNLYMEGYKAGKRDFKPVQGEWLVTAEDNDGVHRICCPFCSYEKGSNNTDPIIVTFSNFPKFCENCGADMQKGGAV